MTEMYKPKLPHNCYPTMDTRPQSSFVSSQIWRIAQTVYNGVQDREIEEAEKLRQAPGFWDDANILPSDDEAPVVIKKDLTRSCGLVTRRVPQLTLIRGGIVEHFQVSR